MHADESSDHRGRGDRRIRRSAACARRRGRDVHRARGDARGAARRSGIRADHVRRHREGRSAHQRDLGLLGGGTARHRGARHEGAPGRGRCGGRAQAVRTGHRGRADAERHSLLVFPQARGGARREPGHDRRSHGRDPRQHLPASGSSAASFIRRPSSSRRESSSRSRAIDFRSAIWTASRASASSGSRSASSAAACSRPCSPTSARRCGSSSGAT